ncbi:hypothetical protein ABW636_08320 [Aquimarina sp. 2201CG1-2-11]|uniref:DinB family protein n=1 Tax=Aquimarina discodermiae TaxID=3231043 RepID=UPI003463317B
MSYKQIPDYPENFSSGNIVSRFLDGLGNRYYWATEGLSEKDLHYKPSKEAMSAYTTIEHMYWLSILIVNSPQGKTCIRLTQNDLSPLTFNDLREKTLQNIKKASELCLGKTEKEIEKFKIIIQNTKESEKREFPFWNAINGPIADAMYHTGQIVSFRRTTENPIHSKYNVFLGKVLE